MLYGAVTIFLNEGTAPFHVKHPQRMHRMPGCTQVSTPLQRGLMFIQQRGLMFIQQHGLMFIYEYKATGVSYFLLSLP